MNISLLFTPFMYPDYVPLGIAQLKSHLESSLPGVRVRTIDLNIALFDRLRAGGGAPCCRDCPSRDPSCLPPDRFLEGDDLDASLCVLGRRCRDRAALSRYLHHAYLFENYYAALKSCFRRQLKHFLEGGTLPAGTAGHLREDAARALAGSPDAVGLSVMTEDNLFYALALARVIKEERNVPVLLGGALMSFLDPRELLKTCPFVDYVFRGEGEESLRAFAAAFRSGRFGRVPGIAFRSGGRVRVAKESFVRDLDTLPFPDYTGFDLERYVMPERVFSVFSSRGCYWARCAFCTHYFSYAPGVRAKSIGRVRDELAHYAARYGTRTVLFVDESIPPRRLSELSAALARGPRVRYGLKGMRPDPGFSRELLERARASGLAWAFIGAESFTQRLLDQLCKGTDAERVRAFIRDCASAGIKPYVSYIVGLPSQSPEEFSRELEILRRENLFPYTTFSPFTLEKGSGMHRSPGRYGISRPVPRELLRIGGRVLHDRTLDFVPASGVTSLQTLAFMKDTLAAYPGNVQFLHQTSDFMVSLSGLDLAGMSQSRILARVRARIVSGASRASATARGRYARYLSGLRLASAGRHREALAELGRALDGRGARPFHGRVWYHIGRSRAGLRSYDAAAQAFTSAGRILGPGAVARDMVLALCGGGRYTEALRMSRLVPESNRDARFHLALAGARERTGDHLVDC